MGKGGNQGEGSTERQSPMPTFRWEEIQKHNLRTDRWLVIDRKVYNVTKWSQRHPGGHRVIGHYSGEDATVRVWGCQPLLSAAGWCQESGVPGRQTDLRSLMERRTSNRERKCTSALISLPESSSSGSAGQTWAEPFGRQALAPLWKSHQWQTARCMSTAHAARWSSRSQGLSKGGARAFVFGAPQVKDGHLWAPRRGA